ncbi:MAG TPA: aminotransferase class I/II-fold pyridoxal phosphate-dependent enzyme [Nitrososphaerales archaeon]|nr:aminotransferase class I/II-fold pyridoxal phosphate-dependent enzyme [Nitrososphaerales archaeon]
MDEPKIDRKDLTELRVEIAQVTKEIIRLAGMRTRLGGQVGIIKMRDSLPIEDEGMEDALIREVITECERVGLDRRTGLKILTVLLAESKKAQGEQERKPPAPIFSRALEQQRKGVKLVRLDVGEPDFPPPKAVLQGCSDALFGLKTHYTESRGIPELREALRRYLVSKHRFQAEDSQVAVTPSGRFAVYCALASVLSEGESAVVLEPNWPAYRDVLHQLGVRPSIVHTSFDERWTPSADQVEEAIRPNTRAIIVSYPNNPTGKVLSPGLFKEILELADDHGLTVVSDEIYNEYAEKPCPSVLETTPKKFVLTSSFSKTWSMTGFRVGYAVSSKETIVNISRMISLMITSVPEFIQWGAIKALSADEDVKRNVRAMQERVDAACEELDKIDSLEYARPDGAMYVFPRVNKQGETGDSFSEKLLTNGVSVVPGSVFGDYGDFFRISLGQPREVITNGIRKMGELFA